MKYKTLTVLFLTVTIFGGCFNNRCSDDERGCAVVNTSDPSLLNVDSSFFYFTQTIPILDSNFTLSSSEEFNHLDIKSKYIPDGAALIGKLQAIDNYEFIIYSYPADLRLPILEVYNSNGKKVNERVLYNFEYCTIDFENNHKVELSADHSKVYRTTVCGISFSAFSYDSILVRDLLFH